MTFHKISKLIIYCSFICCLFVGCIEPVELDSVSFESALVVEATLTNEYKNHEVNLSRVYRLEEDGIHPETQADVAVIDQNQNKINFIENGAGRYVSEFQFKAETGIAYQLLITTKDGKSYTSTPNELTANSHIDDLNVTKVDEEEGTNFAISINTFDPSGNAKYFRYEYEETYQIIPPYWSPYDAVVISEQPPEVDLVNRTREERVCYKTDYSSEIIQAETAAFFESRLTDFPVRTISVNNPIISNRYSILVKQYVQSLESYTFYKLLNSLSTHSDLFSQSQPGYFRGNILSTENADEKVIGFFDICSVDYKRVFFNYRDFIGEPNRPPYFTDCIVNVPNLYPEFPGGPSDLINFINSGNFRYGGGESEPGVYEHPYIMVIPACSDCTQLGSNIKPEFWID